MLLALQRSVGNEVVARMVGDRLARSVPAAGEPVVARSHDGPHSHSHDADPPGGTTLSTTLNVLRAPGRPLAPPVRQEMEARLGADFGSVQVHDDSAAREAAAGVGARAFTSGDHIVIGKGGGDRHTLAHELTHVIQQRQGPVSGIDNGAGLRVSDPSDRFERAAEDNARRSLAQPAPDVAADGTGRTADSAAPPAGLVQRALTVGKDDLARRYQEKTAKLTPAQQRKQLDEMVKEVFVQFYKEAAGKFSPEEREAFTKERHRIRQQLEKAIVSPVGHQGQHPVLDNPVGTHPDFGAKNHDIRVADYTDLARNLMGWVYAKEKRHEEKVLANRIKSEGEVEQMLNVLFRRIRRRIEEIGDKKVEVRKKKLSSKEFDIMKEELTTGRAHLSSQPKIPGKFGIGKHDPEEAGKPIGSYLAHFALNPEFKGSHLRSSLIDEGGIWKLLMKPHNFAFRDKLIALHDLSEYFGHSRHTPPTMGKELVQEIDDKDKQSTVGYGEDGARITGKDRGQAGHPSTRNEKSPTTELARSRRLPVWAGQSYTAARMFKMADEVGASKEEIAAVAWGIFSFWRVDFDHTTKFAYHTLHEVMDIAQNFGVPYHVDDQTKSLPMIEVDRIVKEMPAKLDAVRDTTRQVYEDSGQQVEELKKSPQLTSRDREVRKAAERFLETAKEVRSELREIRRMLRDLAEEFQTWEKQSDRNRTHLLAFCLSGLEDVEKRVGKLDRKLRRLKDRR
ncbi:DUF4157 domain-containing protein [Actinosynnema sp. NPDC023587]|uniref:eCIS core domain-containing protein n=1 Tax=Actinosynnema sp. NPDC023587 TaxID=3154695 RepID=UPI0033DCB2D6